MARLRGSSDRVSPKGLFSIPSAGTRPDFRLPKLFATIASRADFLNTAHTAIFARGRWRCEKRLNPSSAWPNAPRGAARDVKPDGRRPYRTSSTAIGRSGCNVRSIRGDGNKNSCRRRPCDSPRSSLRRPAGKISMTTSGALPSLQILWTRRRRGEIPLTTKASRHDLLPGIALLVIHQRSLTNDQ